MIVRRKATIEGLLERIGKQRVAAPAAPLFGGAEGPAGADGRPAGLRYKFNTNTAESDPGSGKLKLNNAALAAATTLWISETDADGNDIATVLAGWDDSTNTVRGTLTIRSVATGSDIAVYNVTGAITDKGTYDAFTIEHKSSGGAFANEEEITVEFSRAGDKGAEGAEGKEGKEGTAGKEGPAGSVENTDWKNSVRVATTANVAIATALNPGDTLDGIVLAENDRVLVHKQTTTKENGIWVVKAVPVRATDGDAAGELSGGTAVTVESGTIYGGRVIKITTAGSITPGTTAHEWAPVTPKDHGLVEALPTSAAIVGDRCTYKADKVNGIFWDLVYDGEGEFPWKFNGGAPMFAVSNEPRSLNNAAYTSLPTDPLSITVPLKGDYNIRIEAGINNVAAAREGHLSYAIGATAANDIWAIRNISAAQVLVSMSLETRQTGVAASAKVEEKGKSSGEVSFSRRRLWVQPVRVG